MIDWFPVLGNHEYRGNTQAVLEYSNISRRWSMPARYYTKVFNEEGTTVRVVWLDTAPIINKYRNEKETYPDACKQNREKQLAWVDSVLTASKEDWVVVVGHHPIYAETPKDTSERDDLQKYLEKHPEQYRRIARLRRRVSDNYIVSQFCSAFCFCPSCRLHLVIEALTSPRYWRIAAERIWKRLWR